MPVQFQTSNLATPGSTVDVASDTIGGIDYQRIKVVWGTTGTANELTTGAGLPVQLTAQSSAFNVTTTPSSQMTVSTTPTSQITASVTPTTQWTVTTTPSTTLSVAQSTVPWSVLIATSTGTSPQVIGSVAPSSQWTVTTTPSSQATVSVTPTTQFTVTTVPSSQITASVAPTTQWTVTTTPSSQATVTSVLSSGSLTLGYVILSSSTSTSITVPPIIGSVAPTTQWTVSVTPTTQFTVTTVPSSQITASVTPTSAISVNNNTSTGTIGTVISQPSTQWTVSVTPTTQFTVTTTPSSQITASVTPTSAISVNNNSSTGVIGAIAGIVAVGGDASTLYTSGVATTPLFAHVTTTSTLIQIAAQATGKIISVLGLSIGGANTAASLSGWFVSSAGSSVAIYSGKVFLPTAGGTVTWPYNPVGWCVTTTTGALTFEMTAASTGTPGVGISVTYVTI